MRKDIKLSSGRVVYFEDLNGITIPSIRWYEMTNSEWTSYCQQTSGFTPCFPILSENNYV